MVVVGCLILLTDRAPVYHFLVICIPVSRETRQIWKTWHPLIASRIIKYIDNLQDLRRDSKNKGNMTGWNDRMDGRLRRGRIANFEFLGCSQLIVKDSFCISCDVWCLFFSQIFFSSNFVISGAKYDYGLLQWQIMKARSDGKDWWRWSRGVQKDFKPPGVHCPLPCNLVLGVAWIWWRESRTMHISQEGPLG